MKAKDWFADFSRGAALGLGILPGVSVGTVGLIVNVYDKLLSSINGLRKSFVSSFLALLPIALGCVITALFLFWAEKYVYDFAPFATTCVFAGFTLGGLPVVLKEIKGEKLSVMDFIRIVVGFLVAAGIGVLTVTVGEAFDLVGAFSDPFNNAWIFAILLLAGFAAAVACLIPGISGSMIIFIFGIYNPVRNLPHFEGMATLDKIAVLLAILVGAVAGIFAISKLMANLLGNHKRGTFTSVLGFVLGSIASMFVNNQIWDTYSSRGVPEYLIGIVLFIVFALATAWLLLRPKKKENA